MRSPYIVAGLILFAALTTTAALAEGPDISAQRLVASWHDDDPGMRMVAEVIASAFASGFSWGGDAAEKRAYCAPSDLKGNQIMSAFEAFVRENPTLADQPYGAAMAETLKKTFPCNGQGT
jgi:Rap1a immunity proteins